MRDKKTGVMYRKWEVSESRAVVLLVHGLGAHADRWEFLVNFFEQHGFSAYAVELRGFGLTKGVKGYVRSFDVYSRDISRLREIVEEEHPGKKIFLLGESMGGLISFVAAIKNLDIFSGLICVSPAFKNRLKFSLWGYIKIGFSVLFMPKKQFRMPFDRKMCTRDIGYQEIMNVHAGEHRMATGRLLFEIVLAQIKSFIYRNRIKIPVLFLLAGKDKLVDPGQSRKIFDKMKLKDKKIIEYPEMYHALSIDMGRTLVFEDIEKWISEKV